MNVIEPIFFQARSRPSELALAAPGRPLDLVSYARLVSMLSNVCQRLVMSNLRAGDRVELRIGDPLLRAIFTIALVRLGIIILSTADEGYGWPFEVAAVISTSARQTSAGRSILVNYDWVSQPSTKSEPQQHFAAQDNDLCCVVAEPDGGTPNGTRCFALSHGLLDSRVGHQDIYFGGSIAAARRLFVADGCASALEFQVLISTLSRGAALFLMGDQSLSFNALNTYLVEDAVLTPQRLLDLVSFHETKTETQCELKSIFVVGHASKAILERAARVLGAKLSVGYYLTQPGMVASMPFLGSESMDNAAGFILPGVTAEVVGDDGQPLQTNRPGYIQFRSDLAAENYHASRSEVSFASNQRGCLTEDRVLTLEKKEREEHDGSAN